MASLPFKRGRKLKVHCLIVPLKPVSSTCTSPMNTHAQPTDKQYTSIAVPCPCRWSHPAYYWPKCQPLSAPLDDTLPGFFNPPVFLFRLVYFVMKYFFKGNLHTQLRGRRRLLLFGRSDSGLLQSFQTLRTLRTQQSCVVGPGLARPMGMCVWELAALLPLSLSQCSSTSLSLSLSALSLSVNL